MKDQSILNLAGGKGESYLDDLAFAVCVNGESLEKYKKIVEKKYGTDTYAGMEQFAMTLQQQLNRGQFTNTSLLNLRYMGKNVGLSEDAIDMIIDHFSGKIKEGLQKKEEDECWNNCSGTDKSALLEYLRKYPNGRYAKEAHAKITAINKEEDAKREDTAFWKHCNPNDMYQLKEYLRKYPTGLYAARATSLISDLERIEKLAIEESRMFNQCRTQRDYMDYLSKYPKGAYSAKAKSFIEEFGRKEIEENRVYNLCKNRKDYLDYLKKFPNGRYVKDAQEKVKAYEYEEKSKYEETEFWNDCSPNDKTRLQEYLRKYPNGMYVIRAKSLIADLERFEKAAIEESRMYNQCRTKADYMEYLRQHPNGMYVNQARYKTTHLEKNYSGLGDDKIKNTDSDSKVSLGNNKKKKKASLKEILVLIISAIVLYSVAYLIRDEYENLGPFLCLVSYFPYMLFAFEVVSNKKLGMVICITGWFIMVSLWSDYAIQPTLSIFPALGILGLCSFFAVVAYLLLYREET